MSVRLQEFPVTEGASTPESLYQRLFDRLPSPRNELYFSTPLTSGGARRLYPASGLSFEDIKEIVALNKNTAATVITSLADTISPSRRLASSHTLGYREGWSGEVDYNIFWFYYLSGIRPEEAVEWRAGMGKGRGFNAERLNSYGLTREERLGEYRALLGDFLGYLSHERITKNPVEGLVLLPDHELSLGCMIERDLARGLGAALFTFAFDSQHPDYSRLLAATPLPRIACADQSFVIPAVVGEGNAPGMLLPYKVTEA